MINSKFTYKGRGSKLIRCSRCQISKTLCICNDEPKISSKFKIVIISSELETHKPSNTAKLISNTFRNGSHIIWKRNIIDSELQNFLQNPNKYYCALLYPNDDLRRNEIINFPDDLREKILLVLDGTWKETRRIFNKSPYLHNLPLPIVKFRAESKYILRENKENYYSTVESVSDFLRTYDEVEQSNALENYFTMFNENYWKSKRNIG
jgi:DTW domain-containing protein YfiP